MPVIRQPLRKRCNVQLRVITCLSEKTCDDAVPSRGRSRINQRKMAAKRRQFNTQSTYLNGGVAATIPSPLLLPPLRGHHDYLQSYCQVIPFLSIALSDGSFDPSTLLPPISSPSIVPFTHFIRVQYSTPLLNPGLAWSEYHLNTSTSVLNLIVPTPQQQWQREDQGQTFLTEYQLLLSRDFLSLALPYHRRTEQPSWAHQFPSTDLAHVLVTVPPGPFGCIRSSNVVDVMSIVACYLTFTGGETARTVVGCVDTEIDGFGKGLADVWKGSVKGEGVEVIQRVADAPWVNRLEILILIMMFPSKKK